MVQKIKEERKNKGIVMDNELKNVIKIQILKDKLRVIKELSKNGVETNKKWGNDILCKDILDSIYEICNHKWNLQTHQMIDELLEPDYYNFLH